MNSDFFNKLEAALSDPATSRRDALRKAGLLGGAAALAVTPLRAMASESATTAKSKSRFTRTASARDRDVLNYAIALGYLKAYFYLRAVGGTDINIGGETVSAPAEATIPTEVLPLFETIRDQKAAQVTFLALTIDNEFGNHDVYQRDDFTYEIDGTDVFSDYDLFLTVAQGFEDLGVRAYKGQATALQDTDFLTAALQIHSVEARHAAAIRRLRGNQGWIPNAQPGAPAAIAPIYGAGTEFPSEANTTQAGVELVAALGGNYTAEQITEAFDEALEMQPVLNIAGPFITGEPNDDEEDPLTGGFRG